MKNQIVPVRIGEVKISRDGETLKAILGSCVGIAFIWKERNMAGLAHCLLPENSIKEYTISAKYVSDAIPSLIAMMKITESDKRDIHVHIAGGSNMTTKFSSRNPAYPVGVLNVEASERLLSHYGFRIRSTNTGGTEGRQMIVEGSSLSLLINTIKRAPTS